MRTFKHYYQDYQEVELENEVESISSFFKDEKLKNELKNILSTKEVSVIDNESGIKNNITLVETENNFFIELKGAGLGWGMYPKNLWSREDAINDQAFLSWEN